MSPRFLLAVPTRSSASTAIATATTASNTTAASPTKPRFTPFPFVRDTYPADPLTGYNRELDALVSGKHFGSAHTIDQVLRVCVRMSENMVWPDLTTYNLLLKTYACFGKADEAFKIITEMENAEKKKRQVKPDILSYNLLLLACVVQCDTLKQHLALKKMHAADLQPNAMTYQHLIRGMCMNGELERALDTLRDLRDQGTLQPTLLSYDALLRACIDVHESQLAFELLREAETYHRGAGGFPKMYLEVMRVCAEDGLYEPVRYCWTKIFQELHWCPDQGLCLLVLNVAGDNADPRLASEVIQHIGNHGYRYSEPHFASLLQAFAAIKDLKSAFSILDIMRTFGVPPEKETASPIHFAIRDDIIAIDNAYYALEELRRDGKPVDVIALNVIIHSCAVAGDLGRALATFREADALGVTPDVDTYNAVLGACVRARNRAAGDELVKEMRAANVKPNVMTYSRMIMLCCTQKDYDDAFKFLEEVKGYGIVPLEGCYATLVKKLARERDPRVHIALEEMETFGYTVEKGLREFVQSGGVNEYEVPKGADGYGGMEVNMEVEAQAMGPELQSRDWGDGKLNGGGVERRKRDGDREGGGQRGAWQQRKEPQGNWSPQLDWLREQGSGNRRERSRDPVRREQGDRPVRRERDRDEAGGQRHKGDWKEWSRYPEWMEQDEPPPRKEPLDRKRYGKQSEGARDAGETRLRVSRDRYADK